MKNPEAMIPLCILWVVTAVFSASEKEAILQLSICCGVAAIALTVGLIIYYCYND